MSPLRLSVSFLPLFIGRLVSLLGKEVMNLHKWMGYYLFETRNNLPGKGPRV